MSQFGGTRGGRDEHIRVRLCEKGRCRVGLQPNLVGRGMLGLRPSDQNAKEVREERVLAACSLSLGSQRGDGGAIEASIISIYVGAHAARRSANICI